MTKIFELLANQKPRKCTGCDNNKWWVYGAHADKSQMMTVCTECGYVIVVELLKSTEGTK